MFSMLPKMLNKRNTKHTKINFVKKIQMIFGNSIKLFVYMLTIGFKAYFRGMKREEFVEPIPGRPWETGL